MYNKSLSVIILKNNIASTIKQKGKKQLRITYPSIENQVGGLDASCLLFSIVVVKKKTFKLCIKLRLNHFFCSTLSEFENFLLCERILINVTTCQNETSS
jgi:hypothetical protein